MHRVRPKKFLGQHFLNDKNIAYKIVDALELPTDQEVVLEVGPGTGVLTELLAGKELKELLLVEIDRESIAYLKANFPGQQTKLIEGDFLQLSLREYANDGLRIIGNFPYNISSQIFFKILEERDLVKEVVCMVQKEVANRICAEHGNKTYGILSVLLGAYYESELLFSVPPGVFIPPPKVNSAVMRLKRNATKQLDCNEELFKKIVKQGFQNRRKTLRNALKPIFLPLELTKERIFDKRAEQLSVDDFIELTLKVENWKT